jgi:hypothetical protein
MLITLKGGRLLDDGVWAVGLAPAQASFFTGNPSRLPGPSVICSGEPPQLDAAAHTLSFDPSRARLVNLGTQHKALLVWDTEADAAAKPAHDGILTDRRSPEQYGSGDMDFLRSLPADLSELGKAFLQRVRSMFPGDLRYYPDSKRHVNIPDNFWTISIQTRNMALQVTVRGTVQQLAQTTGLEVKPDRGSYSSFKLSRLDELDQAIAVIKSARRRNV